MRRERAERHDVERNEHQTQPDPLDKPRHDERLRAHLDRPAGHVVQRPRRDQQTAANHQPRVDLPLHQLPGDIHRRDDADPARHQQDPGIEHRIAVERLHHRRQQRERRRHQHADHQHEADPGQQIAIEEQRTIEHRVLRGQQLHEEQPRRAECHHPLGPHFPRTEPVLRLPAIEHQLEHADRQRQHREAEQIEPAPRDFARRQQRPQDREAHRADRHVDVETPAPVIIFGQPATDHRPQDRSHHDPHAPDRHRARLFRGGIDVHHHRLAERVHERCGNPLKDPEDHHFRQIGREATQHRGDHEADHRAQEQIARPDPVGEPPGQRNGDGGSNDIARQHPGDRVRRRAERRGHVAQSDIDDGRIEDLHDRRRHHADRQQRAIAGEQRGPLFERRGFLGRWDAGEPGRLAQAFLSACHGRARRPSRRC